jgi:hypothetical protein
LDFLPCILSAVAPALLLSSIPGALQLSGVIYPNTYGEQSLKPNQRKEKDKGTEDGSA